MNAKTGKEMADELASFVNNYGCDEEGFVENVMHQHRTLQQSLFKLFMLCVDEWSKKKEFEFDGRNEHTVMTSKKIMEVIPDSKYVPFI